jgi:hypothetical protein
MADKFEELVNEMKRRIAEDVAAGFYDAGEIAESAVEMISYDDETADKESLRAEAGRLTAEAIGKQLKDQENWPELTDCDRLDAAFAELEENGVVGRQNFSCCGTCGQAEIWDEIEAVEKTGKSVRGYTFYHTQDTEAAVEGYGLCFNYGAVEEGEHAALMIAWDGSWDKRIQLKLDWKRRR